MKGRNIYFLLMLFCVMGARGQYVFSVENDAVARYMAEVNYEGATYDHSQVRKYVELSTAYP